VNDAPANAICHVSPPFLTQHKESEHFFFLAFRANKPRTKTNTWNATQRHMLESEREIYSTLEVHPQDESEDKRSEESKGRRLNIFSGLDIPPTQVKQWHAKLDAKERDRQGQLLSLYLLFVEQIYCKGDQNASGYIDNWLAFVYRKPHVKPPPPLLHISGQHLDVVTHLLLRIFGGENIAFVPEAPEVPEVPIDTQQCWDKLLIIAGADWMQFPCSPPSPPPSKNWQGESFFHFITLADDYSIAALAPVNQFAQNNGLSRPQLLGKLIDDFDPRFLAWHWANKDLSTFELTLSQTSL
jgi:hypothetical protein